MKKSYRLVFVLLLVSSVALAAGAGHYPGPVTLAEMNAGCDYRELLPRRISAELYNESYYHNGLMEDGTAVYIQFFIHNIGFGSFHPSVDLTVVDADGAAHHLSENYDAEDVSVSTDRFDIRFRDHSISGDPRGKPPAFHVKAWFDDLGADLTYACEAPAFVDKGIYYDGDPEKYSRWITYCPKASITGTIKVEGKERKVRGRGFGDHGKSMTFSTGAGEGGFQIYQRSGSADISIALMESRYLESGGRVRVPDLLVSVGGRNVFFSRDDYVLDITGVGSTKDGKKFPNAFHIEAKNGWFELTADTKMERFLIHGGLFDRLNPVFAGALNALFDDPGYYRFVSRLDYTYQLEGVKKSGTARTIGQIIYAGEPDFSAWVK